MRKSWMLLGVLFFLSSYDGLSQIIVTYAGNGSTSPPLENVPATSTSASLSGTGSFDALGNYYFASAENRIRKVTPSGIVSTVAGIGVGGYSGDNGPATAAKLHFFGMHVDSIGNIYIADFNNNRLRKVDAATGIIHTIAGNGTAATGGDSGPATAAIITPIDVVTDNFGNIYVSDNYAGTIRKIDAITNIITSFSVINGYMCFDPGYNYLYIAGATRVYRKSMTTGILDTFAGTGMAIYNGDEILATAANFNAFDVAIDYLGNVFLADDGNDRIRKIDAAGIIHTIAGTGVSGFSGDNGPASAAQIHNPEGLAFDQCGNLYIAESANNRVRKVNYSAGPTITLTGSTTVALGSTVTVTATVVNAGSGYSINWYNKGVLFSTTTVPVTSYIKTAGTDSITATIYGCGSSAPSGLHVVATDTHTGINSIQLGTGNIVLFPNPITAQLHIGNAQPGSSYTIHEMTGRAVASGILDKQDNEIDMNHMAHGVYLLQVIGSDGVRDVRKVVKE